MKILFEDGVLRDSTEIPRSPDYIIDAKDGVTANINMLDEIYRCNPDCTVYTNSIFAFSNRYAWNPNSQAPDVYIRVSNTNTFKQIDECTERCLREGHNLAKMYVSGEFCV